MNNVQKYEVKQLSPQSNEYELVLYLEDQLTEFADELGSVADQRKDILSTARQIISERYPRVKVTMVKVIIGGMVVSSISLMTEINSASAAEPSGSSQVTNIDGNSIYHQVASGDTLWNLSAKYKTSIDNIKRANNLTSDLLSLNQRLVIPKAFHTVGTGDYLSVLAKQYGVTVNAIKEANGLTSDATRVGQTLIIPMMLGSSSTPVTTPTQSAPQLVQTNSYTVVAGDNLFAIAQRFGTTINALRSANNLTSDLLRIGQVLTIPAGTTTAPTPAPEAAPTPEPTAPAPTQGTNTYTVIAGDNLWLLAKRFGTTIDAIKAANNLKSDALQIGQTLSIPTNEVVTQPTAPTPVEPTPAHAPLPEESTPTQAPNTEGTTHTVVAGDNLWLLANRFGVTIDAIRDTNNLKTDVLQIGQVLTIPKASTGTVQPAPTPAKETTVEPTPAVDESRATFNYIIHSGDTLSDIAKRFGVTVDAVRNANNLTSDLLRVGQVLTIPNGINSSTQTGANTITYITHTVQSGDNVWDLSIRYGIPQAELLRVNNMTTSSMLSIGQKLTIPVHNIAVKPVVSESHGEYMDWWTEAQYVFTIGKTAKVTDLLTGKSFYIKRTIGANHADSETVSVNDTNIAKSIWGGFSWTPRAVILEVDGRKIAASMSFMPHEQEFITGNGITGHFDVYFGNSTRHKDGAPDSSHQAQVERASGLR